MEISAEGIIALCGGGSVMISGLATWAGQLYLNKKNESWRGKTDADLKLIENKLSEKSSIINGLIDMQKSNYNFSQEKRIKAIEEVWNLMCDFHFVFPQSIIELYNVYSNEEIERLFNSDPNSKLWKGIAGAIAELDDGKFIVFYREFQTKMSYNRPFLGEDLYYSFFVFNVFYSRIIFIMTDSLKEKKIKDWQTDKSIKSVLKQHLNEGEYDFMVKHPRNAFDYAIGILEVKILEQINKVLTGNIATRTSVEHVKEIRDLMKIEIES